MCTVVFASVATGIVLLVIVLFWRSILHQITPHRCFFLLKVETRVRSVAFAQTKHSAPRVRAHIMCTFTGELIQDIVICKLKQVWFYVLTAV